MPAIIKTAAVVVSAMFLAPIALVLLMGIVARALLLIPACGE